MNSWIWEYQTWLLCWFGCGCLLLFCFFHIFSIADCLRLLECVCAVIGHRSRLHFFLLGLFFSLILWIGHLAVVSYRFFISKFSGTFFVFGFSLKWTPFPILGDVALSWTYNFAALYLYLLDAWPTKAFAQNFRVPSIVMSSLEDQVVPVWMHGEIYQQAGVHHVFLFFCGIISQRKMGFQWFSFGTDSCWKFDHKPATWDGGWPH